MKFILGALLCLAVAAPTLAAEPPAVSSPAPSTIPAAITAQARQTYLDILANKLDRSTLDTKMNALMTDELIGKFAAQLGPLGAPTEFVPLGQQAADGSMAYVFLMTFADKTQLHWIFSLDKAGKISGLYAKPVEAQ